MRWRRASRSEPSEPPEPGAEVTYDWPEGGGAPFDTTSAETQWVLLAGGRCGRTWPAGDLRDFGSWTTDFERRVPMGYKVIQVAERLAVVDHGTVVREWSETDHRPGPTTTYSVVDGEGSRRDSDGRWISHDHEGRADAIAEARTMTDRRALVVRVLTTRDWH